MWVSWGKRKVGERRDGDRQREKEWRKLGYIDNSFLVSLLIYCGMFHCGM